MKILLIICIVGLIACMCPTGAPVTPKTTGTAVPGRNETVVLLHGLARTGRSMNTMEKALRKEGYQVINIDYPSTSAPIETLTKQVFEQLLPRIKDSDKVHFVTHSMGGILLRQHLQDHTIANLDRVVMLAPPSLGSEVPDRLGGIFLYQWINGPAGNQLGTGANSLPLRLRPPEFELGVIAGDRSINPILSMLIPGPDDGKVSIARARPYGCTDYCRVHATHTFIAQNRKVVDQTKRFLASGSFKNREVYHD